MKRLRYLVELAVIGILTLPIPITARAQQTVTVWGWGYNTYGQLGNGTTTATDVPVQVTNTNLTGVTAIAGGENHSLAIKTDGTVWAWGRNDNGQLGNGGTTNSNVPVQVTNTNFTVGVVAVAAGSYHSLAIRTDGTVWAWGRNDAGQLGNGSTTNSNVPVQVTDLTGVIAIAAGSYHSLALMSDGTVWSWGRNDNGQLGDGTVTSRTAPVQVTTNLAAGVTGIAAGFYHSLALKTDGTVWSWGLNTNGQLGDGTLTTRPQPVQVTNTNFTGGVTAIAAGGLHSLALKSDKTVWAWGRSYDGQLGDGNSSSTPQKVPVQATNLTDVTVIAGGGYHSLALKSDKTVWFWGDNFVSYTDVPVQVANLAGVTLIAGGGVHSLAAFPASTSSACDLTNARTLSQGGWHGTSLKNPLNQSGWFAQAFPSGLTVGGSARSLKLTTAAAAFAFLPQSGTPSALPLGTLTNPTTSLRNTLAGQAVATTLNLALSPGIGPARLNSRLPYAGYTVNEVIALANNALNDPGTFKAVMSNLTNALETINLSFDGKNRGYLSCPVG